MVWHAGVMETIPSYNKCSQMYSDLLQGLTLPSSCVPTYKPCGWCRSVSNRLSVWYRTIHSTPHRFIVMIVCSGSSQPVSQFSCFQTASDLLTRQSLVRRTNQLLLGGRGIRPLHAWVMSWVTVLRPARG